MVCNANTRDLSLFELGPFGNGVNR